MKAFNDWSDVLIIGGGHSAKVFDYRKTPLCSKVLSCNGAVFAIDSIGCSAAGTLPAFFSLDNQWITQNRRFLSIYKGEKYAAVPLETWPECVGIPGVTYLSHGHDLELSTDLEVINGTNSGFGALNLAVHKGARKIYLIGYDMNTDDNDQYVYWREEFKNTLPQLEARGIEVFNLNPNTSIEAFPVLAT